MVSAGWHPDPTGRNELRYHDGSRWTEHVSNQGATATDWELPAHPPTQPGPADAPMVPGAPPAGAAPAAPTPSMSPPPGATMATRSAPTAPPPIVSDARSPFWKNWWIWLAAVVLAVGAIVAGILVIGGDDEPNESLITFDDVQSGSQPATPASTTPSAGGVTPGTVAGGLEPTDSTTTGTAVVEPEPTETTAPPASGDARPLSVGGVAQLGEVQVRLNRIERNRPGEQLLPPPAGYTVSGVEIEACGDGFYTTPYGVDAILQSGYEAERAFSAVLAPQLVLENDCVKFWVEYHVPDGDSIASVTVRGADYVSESTWAIGDDLGAPIEPLGDLRHEGAAIGTTFDFSGTGSVTLASVAPGVDFPPGYEAQAGATSYRIDMEICAGPSSLDVFPSLWLGFLVDNTLGGAVFVGDDVYPTLEPGECVTTYGGIEMSSDAPLEQVVFVNQLGEAIGRWDVG